MNTDQSNRDALKIFEATIFSPFTETDSGQIELEQTKKEETVLEPSFIPSINWRPFEARSGYE